MFLRQLYNRHLAQASYLAGCTVTGEALVVDPTRDLGQYIALAEHEGFRIAAVCETHIHADFVSGARELAARTGARLYLSGEGGTAWRYHYAADAGAILVCDDEAFTVGTLRIQTMHTPGHTPEHLAFLLSDTANVHEPMGIFTGDLLFVGDVGRPDLLERASGHLGSAQASARQLHASLRRCLALADYLQVWPGHGAGSACGKALGDVPQSTVGYERRYNWACQVSGEDEFVARVLQGQPSSPTYFAQMKRVNQEGPPPSATLASPRRLRVGALRDLLRAGAMIVDTRTADAYASGHVPGTINIPLGASYVTWAGWLLPYDRPFALIVEAQQAEEATRQLRLIGLDAPVGIWTSTMLSTWATQGRRLTATRRIDAAGLVDLLGRGDGMALDVREPAEVARGAIPGCRAIPLGCLPQRLDEVPRERTVVVYCQSGTLSAIAVRLLSAAGYEHIAELAGGFQTWESHTRRDLCW
jgi:hydroxyacylglutathione hydrolase